MNTPRQITEAQWRALLARFPGGVVRPHYTVFGRGPGYLTTADLVTVRLPRPKLPHG